MGELLEASNENSIVSFTYDKVGNLVHESQSEHEVESEYNSKYSVSQRTKILSSLGLDLDLTHNELGQLENINKDFGGFVGEEFVSLSKWQNSFKYNDVGQITSRSLSENLIESLSYDNLGRIKNQSVKRKGINQTSKVYTWDIGNRIKSIVDKVTKIGLEYSYDKYGNLEMEKCSGLKLPPDKSTIQRSFDKSGNVYSLRSKADRDYKTGGQLIRKGRSYYLVQRRL